MDRYTLMQIIFGALIPLALIAVAVYYSIWPSI
jgi:hypothetical protein